MDTSLVFMAAGFGSRFGGGVKQLERVGANGEVLMDYAIYDALNAGFNKIVFIIRKDIEKDFREIIGRRIEKKCNVAYAYQSVTDIPKGLSFPERVKPWGTGQAVLACRGIVKEPFCVLNADDFYGADALRRIHGYISELPESADKIEACMAGYVLGNTLSDNGAVTRGVCEMNPEGFLTRIRETKGIVKTEDGAVDGNGSPVPTDSLVSMNMWGLPACFIDLLEGGFEEFLKALPEEKELGAEYLIPEIIGSMLERKEINVKVLKVVDKWFGMTYKEDKALTAACLKDLVAKGVYPESLI